MRKRKRVTIQGCCPHCGEEGCVKLMDCYYGNNATPYAVDIPICKMCHSDEIELRKINNRRYKIVDRW